MSKLTTLNTPVEIYIGSNFGGSNSGTANGCFSIGVLSDSSVIVGGGFQEIGFNTTYKYLAKLDSSSNMDEDVTFSTNLGAFTTNCIIYGLDVQSDDKIIVGGNFTTLAGTTRNRLVRVSSIGVHDTAFYTNLGTGFNNTTYTIKIQSDGKILVGGDFTTFNSNTRNYLTRLNLDGTEDTSFYTNLGTGFNGRVRTVRVQSDGKILVGGNFTSLNGNTRNRLVRLNSDGTEDTTFYTNMGTAFAGNVNRIDIQSTGSIIVVGAFTAHNSNTRNRMVRLASTGVEDSAFYANLGTGFSDEVYACGVDSADRIYVGGEFLTLNGGGEYFYARLNSNGTNSNYVTSDFVFVNGSTFYDIKANTSVTYWAQGVI